MTALALVLARAGGWPRMLLLAACTAVVSGLLLVVVSILRLPEHPTERLFDLVAEPGLRGGTAFAAALLILPPLLLLYQAVRLGTAVRERRLAALRVAGATPAEIRRLGAVEVGLPASAGAVLGVGVYLFLRASFGGARPEMLTPSTLLPAVRLVPTTVAPAWWQFLAVVVGVAALGAVVGARASRHLVVSPLGVTRRQVPPPPRPWGLLLLGVAVAGFGYVVSGHLEGIAEGVIFALIGLAVVALVSLAPWVAYRVGVFTHSRVGSPALLLASRRLVSEPRAVGRAAAATGGIALVAGGLGAPIADLAGQGGFEAFYVVSFLLVAAALMVALLVVMATLAVHSVESLLDRKRSMAALLASGTPLRVLERSQRYEIALVTIPMAVLGVALGSLPTWLLGMSPTGPLGPLIGIVDVVLTLALVWVAIVLAVRFVRPWLRRATEPTNLRTE